MALTTATSHLDPKAGALTKEFHCFPNLPAELRVRVWRLAYSTIPYTRIYRFRLKFSPIPEPQVNNDGEVSGSQAFLVPLEEVGYLTRECRNLRKVNAESRYESEHCFDGYLRLNQTEKGGITDFCPPINIPWKSIQNFFCFVRLDESDLRQLNEENTVLIAQVFSTVVSLGLGVDRALENGLANTEIFEHIDFARFILRFPKLEEVSLVSDLLMTETDLDNIGDHVRSRFQLESWKDWVGRVPEEVIGSRCVDPEIVTKEDHLEILEEFAASMYDSTDVYPESANLLCGVTYGMMFRTEEDLRYLLWSDEMLDDDSSSDEFSDEFSDDSNGELNEEVGNGGGDVGAVMVV